MVRRVRADRERQPMAIHNRHDFHAFSALRWSDFRPAPFGHNERRIDEAFFFIQRAVFTKLVGNVRQNQTQNLVAAPSLKASMHSFVVRITLRQHVPLRTCVENPQNRFQHMTSRNRLASSTPHREYAPPENAFECAPTVRPSAESFLIHSGSTAIGNFEIGSSANPRACNLLPFQCQHLNEVRLPGRKSASQAIEPTHGVDQSGMNGSDSPYCERCRSVPRSAI